MKQAKKHFILVAIIILSSLVIVGCRDELAIKDFQIESEQYQEAGYFIGNSRVQFNVELAVDNDDYNFHWTANGGRFLSQGDSKVEYITPRVPGDYNIKLVVKDSSGNELVYNAPFSVRGDYPTAVDLTKAENITFTGGVDLEWSGSEDEDFYSYKILRSNNIYIDDNAKVIEEIYEQENTSYTDFDIEPNQEYSYQIMTINQQGYLSVSNEEMVNVLAPGIEELEIDYSISDIVIDDKRGLAYLLKKRYNKLLIMDLDNSEIINELTISSGAKKLYITKNKESLFLINDVDNSLSKIELDNFEKQKFHFDSKPIDISFFADKLYLLIKSPEDDLIKFNAETMEEIATYNLKQNKLTSFRKIEVLSEGYLVADRVYNDTAIYKLDDEVELLDTFFTGPISNIDSIQKNGEYKIYVASRNFDYISAFNFSEETGVKKVGEFDTGGYPENFVLHAENDILLAAYNSKSFSVFSQKDYSLLNKINLKSYAYDIKLFSDNNVAYLLTSDISGNRVNVTKIDLEKHLNNLGG